MIKLVYCVRKKEELSDEEFRRLWKDKWAPRMAIFARRAGAVRWAQSTTLRIEANTGLQRVHGLADPFDGVAEVWWEKGTAFQDGNPPEHAMSELEQLREVGAEMVDYAKSHCFFVEERLGASEA